MNLSKIVFATGLLFCSLNSCKDNKQVEQLDNKVTPKMMNDTVVTNDTIVENDANYLVYATEVNLYQIEVGKLALQKALNADVKDFARMLIDDHTKSLEELKVLANKKALTMPTTIPEEMTSDLEMLKGKATVDFDKEFINMMADDHENAVDKMTEIAQKIKDSDFKLWASRQIDSFITHRDKAKKLKEKLGGN
jgi:putative membrane protein